MKVLKIWRRAGLLSLLLWILAFTSIAFTFISMASIGLLVAPFALIFTFFVVAWAHAWPEAPLGGLIGPGLVCLLVAFLNWDYVPCPAEPIKLGPGQSSFHCGGFDPVPWLIAGILLTGAGIIGYLLFTTLSKRLRIPSSKFE